jgi:protease-4
MGHNEDGYAWYAAAVLTVLATQLSACVFIVGGTPLGLPGGGLPPLEEVRLDGDGSAKVLLVDVSGVISDVPESRAFGLVESESMVARIEAELRRAEDDDDVQALLLHVRSPGGAVSASDDLFRAVRRFADEREVPVVAALGGVAASGGYYVACAGDVIVAHPTAITGSIGVVMVNLNVTGLLDKIGVENATVATGTHKDMLSPLKKPDPEERAIAQDVLATLHERFLTVVRERRPGLGETALASVRDGRIVDARRAVELGLADRIGDLLGAVEVARGLVGEDDARVIRYRRRGEAAETLHALAPALADARLGDALAGVGLALEAAGPRFLYLWMPAAGLTRFVGAR